MWRGFISILKKDFKLILSSKFFLLALGSLILYSCYINFVYVKLDQDIYPVYIYDPMNTHTRVSSEVTQVDTIEDLKEKYSDGYSVGIDASSIESEIVIVTSGITSTDNFRAAYALSLLSPESSYTVENIGQNDKEMKNRREITSEFLFFELAAVGFLGLASLIFKEKQMGVIRVHGILPVNKSAFIISKLCLFLLSDLVFTCLLSIINLGLSAGWNVLPVVFIQAGILSIIMALAGLYCAIRVPDFKQFSLLYLVLAIFITTPVFLAAQTNINWNWINYHPMYHLFMGMKNSYFSTPSVGSSYYLVCALAIVLLFLLVHRALTHEMAKEG
ncbi:ABC transporter permease [Alkalibaculum sp. M08DMB]|uniref:ABC transporter permease n=1 Tax=Alkalibaculum sporogenes TaxID=2655001 RepID=A0A6A7K7Y0_9FIRM|nr:ABC transporter permease [Alkalibaculum sporogenes]MPW25599.1 ABC transporter permease [Alkalibaculum sporogenes]